MAATTTSRKTSGGRLLNRELSTLEYNARLLDLAADDSLPILERVRMCRFVSSNLDEFFMVRVAGLMGQAAAGLAVRSADGLTPRSALSLVRESRTRADRTPGEALEEGARSGARG